MPRIKAGSLNINYETFGDGEPLLLIMGFGMPGRAWLPRIPRFNGFKVIIYDNRGTGDSDKPDQPVYAIADMADDASALLRALNIPRVKICGFSMGGMIAQELALRHPDQVIKAVFGCTVAGGPTAQMENPGGGDRAARQQCAASKLHRRFPLFLARRRCRHAPYSRPVSRRLSAY